MSLLLLSLKKDVGWKTRAVVDADDKEVSKGGDESHPRVG